MNATRMHHPLLLSLLLMLSCSFAQGDDPKADAATSKAAVETAASGKAADRKAAGGGSPTSEFVLQDEVRDALLPLLSTVAKADVSRVTIEMSAESAIDGAIVDSQKSTYQIASRQPNQFTIYLKEAEQRTRIYCDGRSMVVAMAPDAYFRLPEALNTQRACVELPVPMGPYPEPILALSLAGVDPAIALLGGMKSVEVVDRNKFRGKTPSIHFRGVQNDSVSWDLWITEDDQRKPLRLLIDMTSMLKATDQVHVPENFSYQLRIDFLSWRMSGDVDAKLFTYVPPKDAVEYESLDDYFQSIAGVVAEHPLLGKPAPDLLATTLDGKEINSKDLTGKVVVLDFWATWCEPCVAIIPILQEVSDEFADKGVVFYAVNTGESSDLIKTFMKEQEWDLNVLMDPQGKVADAFQADAIPQTVILGKNGIIESVHIGFIGADALKQRLTDELKVLSSGGRIASAEAEPAE